MHDRTPSEKRSANMSAPRKTVAPDGLVRSMPISLEVGPPSFPGRSGDSVAWKERFMTFAGRRSFGNALGYAGNIAVEYYFCSVAPRTARQ